MGCSLMKSAFFVYYVIQRTVDRALAAIMYYPVY